MSERYELIHHVRCLCGHVYGIHRLLGGECLSKVEFKGHSSCWAPCRCITFDGEVSHILAQYDAAKEPASWRD